MGGMGVAVDVGKLVEVGVKVTVMVGVMVEVAVGYTAPPVGTGVGRVKRYTPPPPAPTRTISRPTSTGRLRVTEGMRGPLTD